MTSAVFSAALTMATANLFAQTDAGAASTVTTVDVALVIGAVGGVVTGILGYRRGVKKDTASSDLLEFAKVTETYARMVKDAREQVHFVRNEAQATIGELTVHHKTAMDIAVSRFSECEVREKAMMEQLRKMEGRLRDLERGAVTRGDRISKLEDHETETKEVSDARRDASPS